MLQQVISSPSTNKVYECMRVGMGEGMWMEPYIRYLKPVGIAEGEDKSWVRKVFHYTLLGDDLLRIGYSQPLLKCVTLKHVEYIIRETHEGIYGYHSRTRTMMTQIF